MLARLLSTLKRSTGSTPMRQAIGLVAVVAVVNLVTLGLAYLSLRSATEEAMRANLIQHLAGFQVAASSSALEILVAAEANAADPAHRVFAFIAPDGRVTGNANATLTRDGVKISQMPEGRPLSDSGYFPLIERMAGGVLILGESRAPVDELGETFLALLALSLAPTVLISLGAGAVIASRARRRVDQIEAVLGQLSEGTLNARIPAEPGREDDLARIGTRVNRMAAAQEAATDALRQVSADIAHDLKTPLQRMTVLLHDLRDRLPDEGAEAALADRAIAEADGAVGVFHALLQIAQIEGGGARAAFVPVDLSEIAAGIVELYLPAAEEEGRRLVLTLPGDAAMISGNKGLIGQALANLIENALRHTPAGADIAVAVQRTDTRIVLEVADRGPGIPEAERENVLRRLYRLERSRTTPGNGLGLALIAATAGLHGAHLTLGDNSPGLKVTLAFPRLAGIAR
ncbi:HAMP domain-containing sensor histidine kinase [Defluviimonas aestuarii]|uniref:sensor histidine kinase n=1 Tax=Albidovulum aestuarii TaxID=1130726 RepID=UPI00249CEDF5|nr:HAMP domain-containing sensor histidine kinase [Defluviimonas aestuarii]MDI3337466.1 HAMP domain-containing sensor histidine kinase [Defluviimonas aestuarii]